MALHIVNHPVASHILTLLRSKTTEPARFRTLASQLTYFLIIEATRNMQLEPMGVETPLTQFEGSRLQRPLAVVPILRAGLAMLQPILDLMPDVCVGYLGLERDETTAQARSYYCKLPDLVGKQIVIVDPMLATGGSAKKAVEQIKAAGGAHITMVSVVAAPEGVKVLESAFPDVEIFTAALDSHLNSQKYIVPGLGDFGDRLFGT